MAESFYFFSHYNLFCKLTMLNAWETDWFIAAYKFTYFELFYEHVISLIFFSKQQSARVGRSFEFGKHMNNGIIEVHGS
jgi:hypothetical protein